MGILTRFLSYTLHDIVITIHGLIFEGEQVQNDRRVTFRFPVATSLQNSLGNGLTRGFFFCRNLVAFSGVGGFWSFNATGTMLYTTSKVEKVENFDDFRPSLYRS